MPNRAPYRGNFIGDIVFKKIKKVTFKLQYEKLLLATLALCILTLKILIGLTMLLG